MILYEYPFNESIRTMLRLEHLFKRLGFLVGRDTGIPDWIILITTLGGISLVGFSGIVLGPLVAGLFLASWSILREQRDEDEETVRQDSINVDASGRSPDHRHLIED